jgi:hypothetical protein
MERIKIKWEPRKIEIESMMEERSRKPFSTDKMENFLDGGLQQTQLKHKVMKMITSDPVFQTGLKVFFLFFLFSFFNF